MTWPANYIVGLCICRCGGEFLSKYAFDFDERFTILTEKACPKCGKASNASQIVYNAWWARLIHWAGKIFRRRK